MLTDPVPILPSFQYSIPPTIQLLSSLLERKDLLPAVFHTDDRPALFLRLVIQRLGKSADLRIGKPLRGTVGITLGSRRLPSFGRAEQLYGRERFSLRLQLPTLELLPSRAEIAKMIKSHPCR